MSHRAIALLIWASIDLLLAAVAAPAILLDFVPGLSRAWSTHDAPYMFDILAPNITLMILPGGMVAGAYYLIARRASRR